MYIYLIVRSGGGPPFFDWPRITMESPDKTWYALVKKI